MRKQRHKRITAFRAIDLLRKLERAGRAPDSWVLDELKTALDEHIKSFLNRKR